MSFSNILIFRIGHFGDTVMALPAFWAVRDAFPDARVSLLTNFDPKHPQYVSPRAVLPEAGLINDWLAYPSNLTGMSAAAAFLRLALELRRRRFDALFYLMPRLRTPAQITRDIRFFRFAGIERVVGADYISKHPLGLDIPKPTPEVETEADFLLAALRADGVPATGVRTDLLLAESERSAADSWLRRTDRGTRRIVAVAPGSKWPSKVWFEDRFFEVGQRLTGSLDCYPVIIGGPEDKAVGDRLIARWRTGANAAGALSIRETAALLERCSLYLGNDTGNMHLAGAIGVPCVAVFAALDWRGRWHPFGERNRIFRKSVECEGCHTPDCFNAHKCLDLVSADEVYEACREFLVRAA